MHHKVHLEEGKTACTGWRFRSRWQRVNGRWRQDKEDSSEDEELLKKKRNESYRELGYVVFCEWSKVLVGFVKSGRNKTGRQTDW